MKPGHNEENDAAEVFLGFIIVVVTLCFMVLIVTGTVVAVREAFFS